MNGRSPSVPSVEHELERGRLFEQLINQVGDCVYIVDSSNLKIVDTTAAVNQLGYTPEELIGRPLTDILTPHRIESGGFAQTMKEVLNGGRVMIETAHRHKDGSFVPSEVNIALANVKGKKYFVGISRDITKRVQARQFLQESEERYRNLVEQAFEGFVILDGPIVLDCNEGYARMMGYAREEVIGKSVADMVIPDMRDEVLQKINQNFDKAYEASVRHRDGHVVPLEIFGSQQSYKGRSVRVTVFRDLTNRKRAEEERRLLEQQLQRAQRMESLGTLVAGVAHDFNNLLQGIMLGLDRLENKVDASGVPTLEDTRTYSRRGKQLVQQIMNFARADVSGFGEVSVGQLLEEVKKLFDSELAKGVKFHLKKWNKSNVIGSEGQILQGLVNLCNNAIFELHHRSGERVVEIESSDIPSDHEDVKRFSLPFPPYVRVVIEDSGSGVPLHLRQRVFEPFFTTKETGKGLGLGLSQVHRMITNHLGHVDLSNSSRGGAKFSLYFPVSQPLAKIAKRANSEASDEVTPLPVERMPLHQKTIMVIDDEVEMVRFFCEILKEAGYKVISFSDANEASIWFGKNANEVDMVLSDQTMPGVTGLQLAKHFESIRRGLPFILMSGFAQIGDGRPGPLPGVSMVLEKPFNSSHLLAVMAQIFSSQE